MPFDTITVARIDDVVRVNKLTRHPFKVFQITPAGTGFQPLYDTTNAFVASLFLRAKQLDVPILFCWKDGRSGREIVGVPELLAKGAA
jgi:hypothetical protein